jgi:hypothetical protein
LASLTEDPYVLFAMRRTGAGWKPFLHKLREADESGWSCTGGGASAGNGVPTAGLDTAARV